MEADLAARAMLNVYGDRTYGDTTYGDTAGRRSAAAASGGAATISGVTRRAGARQQSPSVPEPPSSLAALVMADLSATLPREERADTQPMTGSARPLQAAHQARVLRC